MVVECRLSAKYRAMSLSGVETLKTIGLYPKAALEAIEAVRSDPRSLPTPITPDPRNGDLRDRYESF